MKRFFLFFVLLLPSVSFSSGIDSLISFLPSDRFVPSFTASGTEHRVSLNKQLTRGIFIGSMGGIFPVADIHLGDDICQFSIAATVYTSLQNANIKFDVTNVDFYVDFLFDIPLTDRLTTRVGWGHTSHHLADDAVGDGLVPINYARDYYQLFGTYSFPSPYAFVYGGVYWTYSFLINANIGRKLLPEFGGETDLVALSDQSSLFAALDCKYRGEVNFGSTQSYQFGYKIHNQQSRNIRLAYTFRTGIDERGQFYSQHTTLHTVGLFFDF